MGYESGFNKTLALRFPVGNYLTARGPGNRKQLNNRADVEGVIVGINKHNLVMVQEEEYEKPTAVNPTGAWAELAVRTWSGYQEWCAKEGVTHAHCPHECDHPQPFMHKGELVCGACFFENGTVTPMVPCTPEKCPDA